MSGREQVLVDDLRRARPGRGGEVGGPVRPAGREAPGLLEGGGGGQTQDQGTSITTAELNSDSYFILSAKYEDNTVDFINLN